jgi:hypothetical protein
VPAEGASGTAPDWLGCATLTPHTKQQAVVKNRHRFPAARLPRITRAINVIERIFLSGMMVPERDAFLEFDNG